MVRIRPVAPNQPACCRVDRGGQKPGDLISVEGGEEFVYQHTRRKFRFDKVFTSTPSNDGFQGIQKAVLPLAMSAMDGYNVCIFAYGQTGSGKTLTMDSVTAAVCNKMFNARDGFIATVSVSYVEVYNNEVRDLLRNPKRDGRSGEDGWNSHSGSTVKIPSVDVRTTEAGTVEVRRAVRQQRRMRRHARSKQSARNRAAHNIRPMRLPLHPLIRARGSDERDKRRVLALLARK